MIYLYIFLGLYLVHRLLAFYIFLKDLKNQKK